MEKLEFAQKVSSMQVVKRQTANGAPSLTLAYPTDCGNLSAANSPDSVYKEKAKRWIYPFNSLISKMAERYGYIGDLSEFFATSASEVNGHCVIAQRIRNGNDFVYIRKNRGYNNNGSGNRNRSDRTKGAHTTMKNRKVTLTLFTVASGLALICQITGSSKDATAWTRFIDPDLSKAEYDNITWSKDVASSNKAAVDAVDALIQIETDFVEGKISAEDAKTQFKAKYVEWVKAHLTTNPDFVERRVIGLNVEDPMSAYRE